MNAKGQVQQSDTYIDIGMDIAEKSYHFAFTDVGMFVFIVIAVSVLSEIFLRELIKRATLWTKYNRKKEILLEESIPIFATPVLAIFSSVFYYHEKGIKAIITVCALSIVFSTLLQMWIRAKHEKRKNKKYGR